MELSTGQRRQIITLPPVIGTLTEVVLYGTNLVRVPPEVGAMIRLAIFEPYTSHRLHWYSYKLTRRARLRDSTVDARGWTATPSSGWRFPSLPPQIEPATYGADRVATCDRSTANCTRPSGSP